MLNCNLGSRFVICSLSIQTYNAYTSEVPILPPTKRCCLPIRYFSANSGKSDEGSEKDGCKKKCKNVF